MERLTEISDRIGLVYVGSCKRRDVGDKPIEVSTPAVREMMQRLADYENTGLEPWEILEGKEFAQLACLIGDLKVLAHMDTVKDLVQAAEDGRLIVKDKDDEYHE